MRENNNATDFERFKLIIADYRLDITMPMGKFRYIDKFEHQSLIKWALDELEMYVFERPASDPLLSVSEFIKKMEKYMYAYPKTRHIFFAAVDTATDIHDILLCSK